MPRRFYWAVRPKAAPDYIRIEQAHTSYGACSLAFGRPFRLENWEAKNLGTRVAVIQSDNKRIALLKDPNGWATVSKQVALEVYRMSQVGVDTTPRSLAAIAREIRREWKQPYYGAVPYLNAMRELDTMSDKLMADDARSIVTYFLSNAAGWRGVVAKRVKAELKGMLKDARK